ncbi:MAG: hypothetical protein JWO94_1618, partial [Verrucomicrobiaceae bacterium]|nr:hypothetical protein [Verrucomicrobiaceae bacterium]
MTMFSGPLSSQVLRSACALAVAIGVSSCKTPAGGSGSAYASSEGGGYNPYPGTAGAQNGSLLASGSQPKYAEAPPPPPPGFDGPSEHFESAPPPRHSSSGSGSSKSKSKSSGVSNSSSSKKKGSTGGTTKGGYAFSGGSVHTVKAGDTLYSIADHNHTTVPKLKSLNHLKSGV